jgi:RNA-binding protein
MNLTSKEKRNLKAMANRLKPEVWIGKAGLSEGILETSRNSLQTKELLKVKVLDNCEIGKQEIAQQLSLNLEADVLQILGNIILLYKKLPGKDR